MRIIIARVGNNETIRFAAEEFARYLKMMDKNLLVDERAYDTYDATCRDLIWIGQFMPERRYDDEISITIKNGTGTITGSNERAVLIAVYRSLYQLGCRFTSPEDTYIPSVDFTPGKFNISVSETASYRHRAVCIEGSVSYTHVMNMIDWLPKVGMNGYFIQFRIPFTFFDRFYSFHGMPLDEDGVVHMHRRLVEEIKKRGLLYHATGHGWTCEPFGLTGSGWSQHTQKIPPEIGQYLAETGGRRELWGGVALNTNLCYSNQEVRKTIVTAVTDYCSKNPEIDYLHFWLADGSNNHCECENCRNIKPSDFYVIMLNEIDASLTEACIDTKVVFLIYVDLLWEPDFARINNPDRFILMFAPITRTYTTSIYEGISGKQYNLAPYERNKLKFPRSVDENIARLRKWQEIFDGDSFDFDYHLMWDHINDPGYWECARVLYDDVANLDKINLNGMVSCQLQRVGFPTWLPLYVMAKALWNSSESFGEITCEYNNALFGDESDKIAQYLKKLSELFYPPYLRGECGRISKDAAERFAKIPAYINSIKPFLDSKRNCGRQWEKLIMHADMCIMLAQGLLARAEGDDKTAKAKYDELVAAARAGENITSSSLDLWNYENILRRLLC